MSFETAVDFAEKNAIDRVGRGLMEAIAVMREACDTAEREGARHAANPEDSARRVLHLLTWGLAHASSGIEGAMQGIEDLRAVQRAALEQGQKTAEDASSGN